VANGVVDGLRVMDAERLDFPDASFDKIYSFHAIEHIPRLDRAFAEMARVLRPGGRILLVYPAEPIRGLYVVPTAMILFGNPLRALDIHLHRLTPLSLRRHFAATPLRSVQNALHLLLTPQFVTVLEKPDAPARVEPAEQRAPRTLAETV
jgi:ubiquinone/menaquinone biosynthesis C-methylase UbiE